MLDGRRKIIILLAIFLAASSAVFFGRAHFAFGSEYRLDSPSDAYMDFEGNIYIIDRSKMDIVKATAGGEFVYAVKGGQNRENGFYNVNALAFSPDGRMFVHGLRFEGTSLYLADERILEYTPDGRFEKSLFDITYDHKGPEPRQEGLIRGLMYDDGLLRYAYCGENAITVYELDMDSNAAVTFEAPMPDAWKSIQDVCIEPGGMSIYYSNKNGELWQCSPQGSERLETAVQGGALESTPYRLALSDDGSLLFSDLGLWCVRALDLSTMEISTVYGIEPGLPIPGFDEREILYSVSVTGSQAVTVGDAVYTVDRKSLDAVTFDVLSLSALRVALVVSLWTLAALAAVVGVYLFVKLILYILTRSPVVKLAAVIVAVTIVISFFISALVISGMNANIQQHNSQTILYMAALGASLTDSEALSRINSNSDYLGEDYIAIKTVLDNLQLTSDIYELDLYYLLFKNKGDIALGVMDSENLVSPAFPYGISPEYYNQAAREGVTVYGQVSDTTGMWGFALSPIFDSAGEVAGVLEIGIDMNSHLQFLRGQIIDVILNVFAIAVVFILLTIEMATFMPFFKAGPKAHDESAPYVLRVLTFLLFAACSLQDSFIPVLAMDSYTPVFGIPQSVGGALPITAEMLAVALFALCAGGMRRISPRKLMLLGPSLVALGFAVVAVDRSFWPLLAGKIITGSGLGISITIINGTAAGLCEDARDRAFGGISFGMISGMQVGIVVGSLAVGFLGYGIVFAVSCAIALVVLLLAVFLMHPRPFEAEPQEKGGGLARFLFSRRAGGFLLLVLAPALIIATLVEYYVPIFAIGSGLSEANVGQISLIYGIFIILVGPAVSPRLLSRLGNGGGVALGVLVSALGIGLFALVPGIPAMLVMVFMYGASQSFGIPARFSRFASLREVQAFGAGRAMGVYAMFENLAQSFAPILIASAMATGSGTGAGMVLMLTVGAFMLYCIINAGRRRK